MAKYRTILVAICALMMIGVFAAPVLAQSSGSVANSAQSTNYPPVIVSVTPSTTQNVAPVPEGTAAPTVTLRATIERHKLAHYRVNRRALYLGGGNCGVSVYNNQEAVKCHYGCLRSHSLVLGL